LIDNLDHLKVLSSLSFSYKDLKFKYQVSILSVGKLEEEIMERLNKNKTRVRYIQDNNTIFNSKP